MLFFLAAMRSTGHVGTGTVSHNKIWLNIQLFVDYKHQILHKSFTASGEPAPRTTGNILAAAHKTSLFLTACSKETMINETPFIPEWCRNYFRNNPFRSGF